MIGNGVSLLSWVIVFWLVWVYGLRWFVISVIGSLLCLMWGICVSLLMKVSVVFMLKFDGSIGISSMLVLLR